MQADDFAEKLELKDETVALVADPRPNAAMPATTSQNRVIAGHYEVIEKIGAGGMSTVFKVRHLHLDRICALKLLQKVDQDSLQRFQQEGKASSLLDHPNIVSIQDFGVTDEQPYMLMDYLEGKSLSEIFKESGKLTPQRAIFLFEQIASALAHAHSKGVIHRDIKPSNIMVVKDEDGAERAVLVDFGIAKLAPLEDSKAQHSLTRTGDIFGTPLYMSPEQCLGHPVDARTDIYSLACVLFEALAGTPPFDGDSVFEIVYKQINDAPAPFSDELRKTFAGRNLEAVVLKGMAKTPQHRHRFALEFAMEVKQCEISGSVFSELKSFISIVSGRQKAAEAKVVFQAILFRIVCFFAFIVVANFVFLPQIISSTKQAMKNNGRISEISTDIIARKVKFKKLLAGEDAGLAISMQELRDECRHSPVLFKLYQKFQMQTNKAVDIGLALAGRYSENVMVIVTNSDKFLDELTQVSDAWSDALQAGTALTKKCHSDYLKLEGQLVMLEGLYKGSIIVAPILSILFVVGLLKRHQLAKQRKLSETTELSKP